MRGRGIEWPLLGLLCPIARQICTHPGPLVMVRIMERTRLDRRTFLLGVTAGLTASMLPRAAAAGESGQRILLMGGSQIAGGLGLYLQRRLEELGYTVHRKAKSSTGLARPDFYDWQAEAAKQYEEFQPHATLCLFGGNDGQGLHMGKGASPQWIGWDDDGWSTEYGRRVEQFAAAIAPAGEPVFWVGMPVMRASKLRSRMQRLNEIFRATMEARPGGHFVDTWSVLADADGRFTDTLVLGGKRITVRTEDGVHYTLDGAKVLAGHVVPQVVAGLS